MSEPPVPREPVHDGGRRTDRARPRHDAPPSRLALEVATRERDADRPGAPQAAGARIEEGADAARTAASLSAEAVAIGDTVLLGPAAPPAGSAARGRLIAHELAHVAQQRRDGGSRIDRQGTGSKPLEDRVLDLCIELDGAPRPLSAALVTKADTLGTEAIGVLSKLKTASPAAKPEAIEEARTNVRRIIRSLVDGQAVDAAIALANAAGDAEVLTAIIQQLRDGSDVAGQQEALPRLARLGGEKLAGPTAKQGSADWLEKSTETAGRTFKALEGKGAKGLSGTPLTLELAQDVLSGYFEQSKTDVTADPEGRVSGLAADQTSRKLQADCDVYAAYGARLLRAAGWDTVGYVTIIPAPATKLEAHAAALVRRTAAGGSFDYAVVSSHTVTVLGNHASDDKARDPFLDRALEVYGTKAPSAYKAYYLAAGANGKYDLRLVDPVKHGLKPFKEVP